MPLERTIAKMIFRQFAGQGLSTTRMISLAADQDATYRRQDMLADIRSAEHKALYDTRIQALNTNDLVPRAWINELDYKYPAKYRVLVQVDIEDELTGEVYQDTKSFFTDDYAAVGDYESEFMDKKPWSETDPYANVVGVKVRGMEHNKGMGY